LDLLNDNFFNSISSYNVTTFHYSLNKGTTMTDNIKELANLPVTLLAVTETNIHLQTETGKGVMTLTSGDLSGGGSTVATVDNVVMKAHDTGVLYFLRVTAAIPPVISYYTLAGVTYTPTNAALDVPYGVTTVEVTGTVEITNDVGNPLPISISSDYNSLDMLTCQVLSIGQTSVQSQVVSGTTTKVVLIATIDCWVAYNTNPTAVVATVPSVYLSAGIPSYPLLVNALNTKFAVIAPVGTGKLSLMEYR
jgi:hypothetical protein